MLNLDENIELEQQFIEPSTEDVEQHRHLHGCLFGIL